MLVEPNVDGFCALLDCLDCSSQVELVALQVLQLLKASERLRNSLLHDSNADEETAGQQHPGCC